MTTIVLYIEDQDDNVVLVQRILKRRPHLDLVIAGTGAEGLRLAQQTRPALILLDRQLPDMLGDDVLMQLKNDDETADAVVVMLSGDTEKPHIAAALAAGAAAFLGKPFHVAELLAVADRYCASEPP
ncbi:MAG TPA: response regulator [Actinoplanes sp.]|nr:response regulator [Actinoplanes sp.]